MREAAAIFSMTYSLFFSLFLAVSMRQVDIASKAAFTAFRASPESPVTDIGYKPPAPEVFLSDSPRGRLRYADRLRRPRWRNGQP